MWKKIWHNNSLLAALAGLAAVIGFPPHDLAGLTVLCPALLGILTLREASPRRAAWYGFLASAAIMLGAFYWVVYVIHVFGYLPWIVSAAIYLVFAGFGALNFPLYSGLAAWLLARTRARENPRLLAVWMTAGLPALFCVLEWAVPKLFPWCLGHAFYQTFWVNQIVELTGCSYLTFLTCSLGGALALAAHAWPERRQWGQIALGIAGWCWLVAIGFSVYRLHSPWPVDREVTVALVQANVGSLEKVEARRGIREKVDWVLERYFSMTDQAVHEEKPDLILWPETAVPFTLNNESSFARRVKDRAIGWGVPLITGGYIASYFHRDRDYNAAYLLEPRPGSGLTMDVYRKNILLAFGEYLPFADLYPPIYRYIPQVSNFEHGVTQNVFQLADGLRIGVTICYEAIVPSFFRKVASHDVRLIVNLTNDSWFGPTVEPYQHAALAAFRSIETRIPLLRVTNTGTSFTVDSVGHMSVQTPVYEEAILHGRVKIPTVAPRTVYLLWGDWFVALCAMGLALLVARCLRGRGAPVSR